MVSRTRIVKMGASLLSQFSLLLALDFQLFGIVAAYKMIFFYINIYLKTKHSKMMEHKRNPSWSHTRQPKRVTCIERGDVFKKVGSSSYIRAMASFPNSFILLYLVCNWSHSCLYPVLALKSGRHRIWFSILSPLFRWNVFSFAAILFPGKQNYCACPS